MADVTIVFRNRDGAHTDKIYVNDYQAAAELASKFRNASYIVDIINRMDDIILRWEDGHPDWKHGEAKPIKLTTEAYPFERPEDAFWVAENRLGLLTLALQHAFDVVTCKGFDRSFEELVVYMEHYGGDDIWPLIGEARRKAEEVKGEKNNEVWGEAISAWMSDCKHRFIHHYIEHAALTMHTQEFASSKGVWYFGIELADLTARR